MKFQDYYTTLGVTRSASADEIKRAYRKLAKEWHPDRHPPDQRAEVEQRFKAIAEANEVLSDPEKRKRYDALGQHWRHGQDFQPPPGGGYRNVDPEAFARMFGGGAGGGGFSDFFAQMFGDMFAGARPGANAHRARPSRGPDAEATMEIKVGEALLGGKRPFALRVQVPCSTCDGDGALDGHACPACGGLGSMPEQKTIELAIPKDVRDGQVVRLRGLGAAGEAGPGDLLLTLRMVPDDVYRLRGDDVEADIVVAPWDLVDGTQVQVHVRGGVATATIPPKTKPGQRLRLRGQGLQRADGARSDLLLVVRTALPDPLTDEQLVLLRQLASISPPVRGGAAH
jgi:DnaJ-class molecular chaperone